MKRMLIPVGFILFLLSACSPAKNSVHTTNGGKGYYNLFIIANTADIGARVRLEKESAAVAESKGYKAVKSIDVMPPSLDDPKPPPKEEFVTKAKAAGCDGLLVIYYIREKDVVNYIPGTKFNGTDPLITSLVAGALGYKGSVDGSAYNKDITTTGLYKIEKGFYLFGGLMDVSSEAIIYSEKSDLFDAANLEAFSKNYMADLVKHLEAKKILKKTASN